MKTFSCIGTLLILVCSVLTSASEAQPPPMRFGTATQLPYPVNDEDRIDVGMDISYDGREMYYSSTSSWSTWVAQRDDIGEEFGEPEQITLGEHPSLSSGGLTLFVDDTGEFGQLDIFQLHRTSLDAAWGEPENIGEAINSAEVEWGANISPDGKTLYFLRNNGNPSDSTIWQSKRDDVTLPFGEATRIEGGMANGIAYCVEVTADNLKLFYSTPGGDFYVVSRQSEDADWSQPQYLSREVNSPYFELTTSLSADERTLYFDRIAPGAPDGFVGPWNIWQVPILPSGDFDGNWQLDVADVDALESAIRAGK